MFKRWDSTFSSLSSALGRDTNKPVVSPCVRIDAMFGRARRAEAALAPPTEADLAVRKRRRAVAAEIDRIRQRQQGVTDRMATILEGVYDLEHKPDARTEIRLATQLGLDPLAVKSWFRARRVSAKRAKYRGWVSTQLFSYEPRSLCCDGLMMKRQIYGAQFFTSSAVTRAQCFPPSFSRVLSLHRHRLCRRHRRFLLLIQPSIVRCLFRSSSGIHRFVCGVRHCEHGCAVESVSL